MPSCHGRLTVEHRAHGSVNVATQLFATYPLKLHVTENESKQALSCYLMGYGGGLVGGDSVILRVCTKPKSSAMITSQSTAKAFAARPGQPPTKLTTNLVVGSESLLVWVPQPLQCFAKSQLEQKTNVRLLSSTSSLLLLDWYTGGRPNYDDGGWQMEWFETVTTISCSPSGVDDSQSPVQIFRDATRLSGGVALQRHMQPFHVVSMMVMIGPQVETFASKIRQRFSSRRSYDQEVKSSEDSGLNTHGLVVSCGTFPVSGSDEGGVLVRILSQSIEQAAAFLSNQVGTLGGKLKNDPFQEILALNHGCIKPPSIPMPRFAVTDMQPEQLSSGLISFPILSVENQAAKTENDHRAKSPFFLYQLVDSSTPTGGFVHSNTIEVAWQLRMLSPESIQNYVWDVIMQTITTAIPFVVGSCKLFLSSTIGCEEEPIEKWTFMDQWLLATITSHVSRRASLAQGAGMMRAFSKCFPPISASVKKIRQAALNNNGGNAATCFGATCGLLGLQPRLATTMFLYMTTRDMINSAVRMNLVGPLEGGGIIHTLCQRIGEVLDLQETQQLHWKDSYQVAPVVEVLANAHDRLYTRLFNS